VFFHDKQSAFAMKNPLILAADVDSADECLRLAELLEGKIGAIKIGPRLVVRYGAELISKLARKTAVFIDNKYLDIPNTMEAAVRASFDAGATFTTVHAWAGAEALKRLEKVEDELNQKRPFKILSVTILTSFSEKTLPPGLKPQALEEHVNQLADLVLESGLTGLVCSPHEVAALKAKSGEAFLVTPGVRLPTDTHGDQKRVETPEMAIRQGASAIVVGRPIYEAKDPLEAVSRVLESIAAGRK
jgi:orotidine-5'-phosphate decarboxylase